MGEVRDSMNAEKISVIVPVYNGEHTIKRCLDSLLEQTYQDFKIYVINDGSIDNTSQILDLYKMESKITVLQQANAGVSAARNRGINESRGSFVSFVDADDVVDNTFLSELITPYLENNDLDLSVVGVRKSETSFNSEHKIIMCNREEYVKQLFQNPAVNGYPVNKLYRKDILANQNIYFDKSLSLLEDMEFNLHYLKAINKVAINSRSLYHYIIQPGSAMTEAWSSKKLAVLDSFTKMESLSHLTQDERNLLSLAKVRMLIWLIGQLYRTGSLSDIKNVEPLIFKKLKEHRTLFLARGKETGMKYYMSYLLFTIYPKFLCILARLTRKEYK